MRTRKKFLKRLGRDTLIVVSIGLGISFIFTGKHLFSSWDVFRPTLIYCLAIGVSLWKGNELLTDAIKHYTPRSYSPEKKLILDIVATLLYSMLVIILINVFLYKALFGFDLTRNIRLFASMGIIQLFIAMLISGVFYLMDYFTLWKQAIKKQEELKREALNLSYEALKSQVNPHFLFNSLSVLSALVDTDTEKSKRFIRQLAEVYRYVLEHKNSELVTLEEEIEFAKSFIYLNQIRHDNNLQIDIRIDDLKGYVIPMSLQLLIENALKHNEVSQEHPLCIKIIRRNDTLEISNKLQPKKAIAGNGIGLSTLTRRCEFLFEKGLDIQKDQGYFKVFLPIAESRQLDPELQKQHYTKHS